MAASIGSTSYRSQAAESLKIAEEYIGFGRGSGRRTRESTVKREVGNRGETGDLDRGSVSTCTHTHPSHASLHHSELFSPEQRDVRPRLSEEWLPYEASELASVLSCYVITIHKYRPPRSRMHSSLSSRKHIHLATSAKFIRRAPSAQIGCASPEGLSSLTASTLVSSLSVATGGSATLACSLSSAFTFLLGLHHAKTGIRLGSVKTVAPCILTRGC